MPPVLMAALIGLFAETIQALIEAKGDARRQEDALLAAEEKLSRIRAKQKFG